jgi:hypothetical protein
MNAFDTPVLFLIFNRPDTTVQVFAAIAKAKPRRLFVVADGPRPEKTGESETCQATREIIKRIDWDCEVKTLFRDRNLGCKEAVSSAITWFFEHVEEGIILEDDCLPSDSFFSFCAELLEKYRDDKRVMMISGDNFQDGISRGDASYYFSKIPHIWGWATWRRAWHLYDKEMQSFPTFVKQKGIYHVSPEVDVQNFWLSCFIPAYRGEINTWDYQWVYTILSRDGLSICPQINMVSNIGFGGDATHTCVGDHGANLNRFELYGIIHPSALEAHLEADSYTYKMVYNVNYASERVPLLRWRKKMRKRRNTTRELKAFECEVGHSEEYPE